jgi:hypothetical protein
VKNIGAAVSQIECSIGSIAEVFFLFSLQKVLNFCTRFSTRKLSPENLSAGLQPASSRQSMNDC